MKAALLKKLLEGIPDDTELIVGDLNCGLFWNPVINHTQTFTARKVSEDWAERQLHQVSFFALRGAQEAADPVEVQALFV
jgi:hypothetical protein